MTLSYWERSSPLRTLVERWHVPLPYAEGRSLNPYKLGILVLAVVLNTIAWVLIARVGCHAFGVTTNPFFLVGVALFTAPASSVGVAVLMAAHR